MGGARLTIEAPSGHMSLEGSLKRQNQRLPLRQCETGHIQHLRRAGLEIGESSRSHGGGLLSVGGTGYHKSRLTLFLA